MDHAETPRFLCCMHNHCLGNVFPSCCLGTGLVYPPISRLLHSSGTTCYNISVNEKCIIVKSAIFWDIMPCSPLNLKIYIQFYCYVVLHFLKHGLYYFGQVYQASWYSIVAYLLKARTVEPEKQPLLGNACNIHACNNRGIVGNRCYGKIW
jgi:hypothetical protein